VEPNGSDLHYAVNGWLDSFRSQPRAASGSRSIKIPSPGLGIPVSLHTATTTLSPQTVSSLQKKLRSYGFKGAVVKSLLRGDGGGFTVDYQGQEYKFWIDEADDMKPNFSLTESDKKVIKAFVAERSADSRLLQTDGRKLEKHGLGSEVVARWVNGRIAIVSTESVKSDESIIRLIVKTAGPGIVDFSYARKGHRTHGHGAMGRNPMLDDFTRAFFETALWSTNDESDDSGGEPLDKNYSIDDIDQASLAGLAAECARFQKENADDLDVDHDFGPDFNSDGRAGHDFWLTRCGHGAGFWDGDWPEPQATRLTEASEKYGNVDLYVGDDGVIYASGYQAAAQTPNGRGLYHGTGIGKNDFAIYQGRGNRWRLDLVTGASGTHIDVTGPNSGYENPEAAFEQALHEQHRRGTRGKSSVFIQAGDGYKLYEPEGAHLPFERNGRRTGILSDGTRINCYQFDNGFWTIVPHSMAWDSMVRGKMREMLELTPHGSGTQWTSGQEGRHLGRSIPWESVPANIKSLIEQRVVGDAREMASNGGKRTRKASKPETLDQQWDKAERAGLVREVQEPEIENYFDVYGYPDSREEREQIEDLINLHGLWMYATQYLDQETGQWQTAESVGMVFGNDLSDPDRGGYGPDFKRAALQNVYGGHTPNARGSIVDEHAATELSLYIDNEFSLIGAANSIGKSIDANLRKKVANGSYDSALAPKAWEYLIEAGAKKYSKEYSTGNDWSKIFSAATRRKVAQDFARAWEQENIQTG